MEKPTATYQLAENLIGSIATLPGLVYKPENMSIFLKVINQAETFASAVMDHEVAKAEEEKQRTRDLCDLVTSLINSPNTHIPAFGRLRAALEKEGALVNCRDCGRIMENFGIMSNCDDCQEGNVKDETPVKAKRKPKRLTASKKRKRTSK